MVGGEREERWRLFLVLLVVLTGVVVVVVVVGGGRDNGVLGSGMIRGWSGSSRS